MILKDCQSSRHQTQAVLPCLQSSVLKLKEEKWHFSKTELPFLSHVISASGLHPNPDHVLAIQQAPGPHDEQSLHSFLGLVGWNSKFIPNFATLLQKSTGVCWTEKAQEHLNSQYLGPVPIVNWRIFHHRCCCLMPLHPPLGSGSRHQPRQAKPQKRFPYNYRTGSQN